MTPLFQKRFWQVLTKLVQKSRFCTISSDCWSATASSKYILAVYFNCITYEKCPEAFYNVIFRKFVKKSCLMFEKTLQSKYHQRTHTQWHATPAFSHGKWGRKIIYAFSSIMREKHITAFQISLVLYYFGLRENICEDEFPDVPLTQKIVQWDKTYKIVLASARPFFGTMWSDYHDEQ